MEELAVLLRDFRMKAGLSQQMLADRALISVQAVSALERGYRKVPYRKTLERLADALNLPADARNALELSARRARGSRQQEAVVPDNNLPRRLTSFLGRDELVNEIAEMVVSAPLVSLVGTGGAGKTRTSIEVGTQVLTSFPDGVWFVELAPLNDPELVAHALASTLRVQESPRTPLLATLATYLARKQLLIVLDNCEHVIDQARRVVGSLLRECPNLAMLATSREALAVMGERVYRIPPLAVPDRKVTSPEEALTFGSVALFADRVRATDARFTVTRENVEPIVEICRRLNGLPLALELAAARATVLSPWQIAERLDRVFDLLISNGHVESARHQTMRAVIDWSYDLLSSQARLLFDRISIFAGGFTLETATEVCGDERLATGDVLELLSTLIAQSLVMADFSLGDARYHLLEANRQYALERLSERGEREALAGRQAANSLAVARRLDRVWYAANERTWFRDAQAELDNCRAALEWSLTEKYDVEVGCFLAAALARVWYSLAAVEGRNWVRSALARIERENSPAAYGALCVADAELCGALGEFAAAFAAAERALTVEDSLDELQRVRARQAAGSALGALGRGAEAQAMLQLALDEARRIDNSRLAALALGELGTLRSREGDVEAARLFYAEALAHYVALDLQRPAASIAGNLAEVEFAAGDVAAALHRAEEARAAHEATNNRRSVANDLCNMAAYLVALDCFEDARAHALQALAEARDVKATVLTACVLQHMAAVAVLQNYSVSTAADDARERAAMLLGFVNARMASLEFAREHTERQEYDRMIIVLRDSLGERLDATMELGAEWTEDGAVAAALEL